MIQTIMGEIADRRGWISSRLADKQSNKSESESESILLLDYACGAGTATKVCIHIHIQHAFPQAKLTGQALLPFITQAIGLDLSENMVKEYNNWATANGYPAEKMRAYHLNLLDSDSDAEGGIELDGFDVVVVCMALHHVADAGRLLARLSGCLKPGGVCVVVDGVPTPPAAATAGEDSETADLRAVLGPEQLEVLETINKHGYTEGEMRELYEGAGLGRGFEYVVIERELRFTMFGHEFSRRGFIARGERISP
jgi:SAM-dependent methyltransferase